MKKKILVFFMTMAMVIQCVLPALANEDISMPEETSTVEETTTVVPEETSTTEETTTVVPEETSTAEGTTTVTPEETSTAEETTIVPEETTVVPENTTEAEIVIPSIIKIRFSSNGGYLRRTTRYVKYGSTYGNLPIPTKKGYEFDGWFTDSVEGTKITSEDIVDVTSNITLYAHWSAKTFIVTFNANGGTVDAETLEVVYGNTTNELPVPTREGYEFDGWYTSKAGGRKITSKNIAKIEYNITLYAHWISPRYTVTFDANGGSVYQDSAEFVVGKKYNSLPTPYRKGYKFDGWYTDAVEGIQITNRDIVELTSDITLYAHWTVNTYKVTFNANKGKLDIKSKTVTYGETYGKLPIPTRNGYEFEGWYAYKSSFHFFDFNIQEITNEDTVDILDNITLYARWSRIR